MKKYLLLTLAIVFSVCVNSPAVEAADEWVRTDRIENRGVGDIRVFGTTASTTLPGTNVTLYFEYSVGSAPMSSSTVTQSLESLSLDSSRNSIFSATITDARPNVYNYFRAVRKTVTTSSGAVEYKRGDIYQVVPAAENSAPQIVALVPFNGPACVDVSCDVTIPENFSKSIPVATIYTRDSNSNQSLYLEIESGNTDDAFYINSIGELKVNNVDYEDDHSFDLRIVARDNGVPAKSDFVNLEVTITNVVTEDGTEATYVNNSRNASYVTYGNVGGANNGSYSSRYTGSSYTNSSSNINVNVNYNTSSGGGSSYGGASGGSTYGNVSGGSTTYGAYNTGVVNTSTNTGSTYNTGGTAGQTQNTQNNTSPQIAAQNTQREALIQYILSQIAILQAELNDRIRRGLP